MVDRERPKTYICIRSIVNKNSLEVGHHNNRIGIVIPERKRYSEMNLIIPWISRPSTEEGTQKGNVAQGLAEADVLRLKRSRYWKG